MKKGVFALMWTGIFCFVIASPSFAADEKQGTTDKAEWQKKMDDFQKKREQKIEEMKKGKAATDPQAGQKQQKEGVKEEQQEKKARDKEIMQQERDLDKDKTETIKDESKQKLDEIKDMQGQSREENKPKSDELKDSNKREEE